MSRTARFLVVSSLLVCGAPGLVHAQDKTTQQEANTHFQRAIGLYGEADYRAALVEFKRAYELAPHVTLLYNLGQTYYQLQNYAEALSCFERFLAEGGSAHRQEVESAIGVLRARVGRLDIAAPAGAEISVDDEVVGKAPLGKPVGVSVGRRRITASEPGKPAVTRFVEVAAGETAGVNLMAAGAPSNLAPPKSEAAPAPRPPTEDQSASRMPYAIGGWVLTAGLAGAAVTTGVLASSKASGLEEARNRVPAVQDDLDSRASSAKSLAIATDVLAVSAVVVGGVSLYLTLSSPRSSKTALARPTTRLSFGGSRVALEGSF